jgi:coenzyme F420-0:L-glutamate ligase/coenzyme F420-1:gamma-L-glutamate ligase
MEMRIVALESLPEIVPGDDLARLIAEAAEREQRRFEDGCVVVVGQKVVSKAEGRIVDLAEVRPSPLAEAFAHEHGRDARQVEVVLGQTRRVVKMDRGVLLVETLQGQVCANAGVDASNVPAAAGGSERVTLLPRDADASAQALRARLSVLTGRDCAVIISDTFGRPWRDGLVDVAIGCAGLRPLADYRGRRDRQGRLLRGTVIAVADELAAAAGLVMGKTAGRPAVLIYGAPIELGEGSAQEMLRPPERDLFR